MASINLSVKENLSAKALDKLMTEMQNPDTMLAINNSLARSCDPYVPFLNGPLSQTVEVTPEHVTYIQPYARYQYFGVDFKHTLDYHPLASAMWDKAMMKDRGDEFKKDVKGTIDEFIRRHNDR